MNILPVRHNITIVAMEILKNKNTKKSKNTDKCDSIEQRKKKCHFHWQMCKMYERKV